MEKVTEKESELPKHDKVSQKIYKLLVEYFKQNNSGSEIIVMDSSIATDILARAIANLLSNMSLEDSIKFLKVLTLETLNYLVGDVKVSSMTHVNDIE